MKDVIKETQLKHDIKTRGGVFERFNSGDDISVSLIQRKCNCGYFSASRVLENLIDDGLVERTKGLLGLCTMV
tara:strand:- start:1798 stop:2016 length:219 start_codon:yes stop_codon:yes gene_type:complete